MTGVSIQSMKYLIELVKLDSLSCSNPSVWLLVPALIIAKERGVHGEHWHQKNNLFLVGETRELCFNYSPKKRRP